MIGIDLGTTNSLVAIMDGEDSRVLPNEMGEFLTPSAVAVAGDGALLVGRAAKDRLQLAPDAGQAWFKRDMGTDTTYSFGGRAWTPSECSAVVLQEMKRIAEVHTGSKVYRAVISVPAYFHDQQRQATIEAAEIAGLKVDRIINEPTAAALAYGYRNPTEEQLILVFDIGGGTFDVTLLEIYEKVIEVKASGGDSRLGGEDYTDALLSILLQRSGLSPTPEERARWRQQVEVAKRVLATDQVASVTFGEQVVQVSRENLAEAGRELTARLRPVVLRCLRDAGVEPERLDDVLLVGGASRMNVVRDLVQEMFGRIPNAKLDADKVVAQGAAVQSKLCGDNLDVDDIVLTDVCPHTLGVEFAKQLAPGHIEPGFFAPIVDRNTTVPVSRSDRFGTMHPEQDEVILAVYQGEHRLVADNQKIGEVRVGGLRHRPGQKMPGAVEVRFSYDMNGILEVEAMVMETGKKVVKVFEQRPGSMTREQIEEAIRRLQPLKVHPRDQFPNRARLERANRLFEELRGPARSMLQDQVTRFEQALETQDDEQIRMAALYLDNFMKDFFKYEGELQPVSQPQDG